MAGINSRCAIELKLRPVEEVRADLLAPFIAAIVNAVQNIQGAASVASRKVTGNNARSIGWAVSYPGAANFTSLLTIGNGADEVTAIQKSNEKEVVAIVAGTSGYSGYLEDKYPYIFPAFEAEKGPLALALEGILK